MPTYDYRCDACDHEFELFQSINDAVKTKCPKCGKRKLRRLFGTGGAIVFKGSGFYQTDYRSESYQKRAKAEEKSTSESNASSSTSSSSKSSDGGSGTGAKSPATEKKSRSSSSDGGKSRS